MDVSALDIDACYRRYAPMVYRRCVQLLGDSEHAADCMQEVFVRFTHARTGVPATSALLNRIATHLCLNALRDARRRKQRFTGTGSDAELAQDLESRVGASRLLEWLFGAERPSTRTMAVLHYLDGLTLEEVAKEVGMSVSGVRFRLRLIRARLKDLEER
ncbi:MAG: RNA polymerase sigma factor [Myxococcaceae bacterium]